jgi:hypothetical protein
MDATTTRRAIEICLSRIKLQPHSAADLARALTHEISKPTQEIATDADAVRASLHQVLYHLSDADASFSKAALVFRIQDARQEVCRILEGFAQSEPGGSPADQGDHA